MPSSNGNWVVCQRDMSSQQWSRQHTGSQYKCVQIPYVRAAHFLWKAKLFSLYKGTENSSLEDSLSVSLITLSIHGLIILLTSSLPSNQSLIQNHNTEDCLSGLHKYM